MANDLVAKLGVDAGAWDSGFAKARSTVSSWGSSILSLMNPVTAALGASIAGIWGGSESVGAYKESLEAQRKLSAVFEATGGAAGLTTAQVAEFSAEMQKLTNFEDDATTASASVLAAFTNVRGQTFTDTIESAMDLSTVMGGDLQDNVKLLGKALNDPSEGFGKLAKAGVQFTDAEQKQITALQQAGKLTEAQGMILDKVKSKFGGAAEAVVDPWKQLQNTMGDVSENIGSLLLPTLDVLAAVATSFLGPVAGMGDGFKEFGIEAAVAITPIISGISQLAKTIAGTLGSAFEFTKGLFSNIAGLTSGFGKFFEGVDEGAGVFEFLSVEINVWYSTLGEKLVLAADTFALFFVQIGADTAHFFTGVIPAYFAWFGENWSSILSDMATNEVTAFKNIGKNIQMAWGAIKAYLTGAPLKFNWTDLEDGFVNTVKKLPDVPPRAISELEQGLKLSVNAASQNLFDAMKAKREELYADNQSTRQRLTKKYDANSNVPAGTEPGEAGAIHESKTKLSNKAILSGSSEAAALTTRGLGGNKDDKQLTIAKESLNVQKDLLAAIKDNPSKGFGGIGVLLPGVI